MTTETILIVDDEQIVRRLMGDALQRAGYAVELAASGAEALERLSRPGIDLMLLDLQLGDLDGVQVMRAAREYWPELQIVMLTAHGSLPSAIAAVRHGAADYLLKPLPVEALRERVAAVLRERRAVQKQAEQLRSVYTHLQSVLTSAGMLQEAAVGGPSRPAAPSIVYEAGPLRVDVRKHTALMFGRPIDVTPSEFAILLELLGQPGAVVPCLRLTQAIHTPAVDEEEARQLIRPHIVRLRRKLEADPQRPCHLLSVRGVGYRWESAA
jgi:two-component system KDP operon response regulator KdpE